MRAKRTRAFPSSPAAWKRRSDDLGHYDYWSDKVRRSILLDCKADLLAFGMGEEIDRRDRAPVGQPATPFAICGTLRGVAYTLGASETPPPDALELPSFEEIRDDKLAFAEATRIIHHETNPVQRASGSSSATIGSTSCATHRALPISAEAMDAIYELPYTRRPHPSYRESIPAYDMIKDSITIMRGCFGGCTFCSITTHQGRIIQSRSHGLGD